MAITPRLELRQSQTLVMTPQLQQAIKLLQLSNLDLTSYVEQELEKNPLLERAEPETAPPAETRGIDADPTPPQAERDQSGETLQLNADSASNAANEAVDGDYENNYTNDSVSDRPAEFGGGDNFYPERPGNSRFDNPDFSLEQTLSEATTLKDFLTSQLHMEIADPVDRAIGAQLIGLVDDAGYIGEDLGEVAARLGCPQADLDRVLLQLQQFEPAGVFARSLKECLALQLKDRNRCDPAMETLLEHLELLARRDLAGLMRLCGVDAEDINQMVAEIKALNPKPGLIYQSEITQTLIPDVFVRQNPDGGWLIELNSDTLPRVLVNTRYYAKISGSAKDKTEKAYLSDCLNSANWLVKSLDQRANTILKVATEIVRQQDGFFAHGVQYLRPLNLRAIADAISMHESTVSRVTANKYMATPRGIFELKYFFTSAIAATGGGESHSAEAVRHRIRELIESESADDVYSDDRLVEILVESGIDIARRTVAKYRESMRIPSSVLRRRLKKQPA